MEDQASEIETNIATQDQQKKKPWDAKLAYQIVLPFKDTFISPNAFTTLRLLVGIISAYFFAEGEFLNLAALLFALSHLLDHTDGELARLTNKTTRFGHYYDLASDAFVMILLFISIGIGLSQSIENTQSSTMLSEWSMLMGMVAGVSVAMIFQLRNIIENNLGKTATEQAHFYGFEVEDILYLLPMVTLFNGLPLFLLSAAIGAPIGAIIVWRQYQQTRIDYPSN